MPRRLLVLLAAVAMAGCAGSSGVSTGGSSTSAQAKSSTSGGSSAASSSSPRPGSTASPSTTAGTTTTTAIDTDAVPVSSLAWKACGQQEQCATLTVPLDYSQPGGQAIHLNVKKRPAEQPTRRIGFLLVNPGGPGVPGTELVDQATSAFSQNLLDRFDVIAWDPRGTTGDSAVRCVDNLDPYYAADPTPDTPEEKQHLIDLGKQFAQQCEQRSGKLLPHISTQDTARDMDLLRRALGDDKISYFGFSYGSELGATYATLYPEHVRAMVLDGSFNPNGYEQDAKELTIGSERALDAALQDCATRRSCPFRNGGNPGAAFDALMASLDQKPARSEPGRPPVNQGVAYVGVQDALYLRDLWPTLMKALADAQKGDGRGLLALYDDYIQRNADGTRSNEIDMLYAVNCLDDPGPQDLGFPDRFAAELQPLAPRFAAVNAYNYFCTFWPVPPMPKLPLTAAGAGPVLVVGTTGDPVTPIESSKAMAASLQQGHLLTVVGNDHTGYGINTCSVNSVDNYLVSLKLPPDGTVCR